MLDRKLIDDFREEVNDNYFFACFYYQNRNGKNLWSIICSAMDWIDVSVDYLNDHQFSNLGRTQSIELFSLIECCDIITEAIEQLHRVLFSTKKRVFGEDNDCFEGNIFSQKDREYFKTIRACFGAHPVNLDDSLWGDEKKYASWSGRFESGYDFDVVLYSNKPDRDNIYFHIRFNQIEKFVNKYYNHLPVLKKQLSCQYRRFCEYMRKQPFDCAGTYQEQLLILQEESKKRLDIDYYSYIISEVRLIYETPITCANNVELVEQYRNALVAVINEVKENLQNMTFTDLSANNILEPTISGLPKGWTYSMSKLYDAARGLDYPDVMWIDDIEQVCKGSFVFDYYDAKELYVLVKSALYHLQSNMKM